MLMELSPCNRTQCAVCSNKAPAVCMKVPSFHGITRLPEKRKLVGLHSFARAVRVALEYGALVK
jgi:hypothetical protein